jgi:hypothetical protein
LVTPAVPPFSRVANAPEPYTEDPVVGALLLATAEPDGAGEPEGVRPRAGLRCPPPAVVPPREDDREEPAPLVVPEAVADEPLVEPVAVAAALVAGEVDGAGAGAGATAAGAGATAEDGGGGAGGVEGVP